MLLRKLIKTGAWNKIRYPTPSIVRLRGCNIHRPVRTADRQTPAPGCAVTGCCACSPDARSTRQTSRVLKYLTSPWGKSTPASEVEVDGHRVTNLVAIDLVNTILRELERHGLRVLAFRLGLNYQFSLRNLSDTCSTCPIFRIWPVALS